MLADLMVAAERRGLTIHPDKTKILSNIKTRSGIQKEDKTQVAGKHIEIIPYEGYIKYLGRKVGFSSFRDMEVDNRVFAASSKFYSMKDVLCNTEYPLNKRIKLFNVTITLAILYGAGTWTMRSVLDSRLRKTQRRMLRSIFQKGRRRIQAAGGTSEDRDNIEVAADEPDEELEPWHVWIQRVTKEIDVSM